LCSPCTEIFSARSFATEFAKQLAIDIASNVEQGSLVKTSFGSAVLIVALSLAAWVFFYLTTGPLKAPETMVVVGFCAIVVISAKWLWIKLRKANKENSP
jgi:hypothetical protein